MLFHKLIHKLKIHAKNSFIRNFANKVFIKEKLHITKLWTSYSCNILKLYLTKVFINLKNENKKIIAISLIEHMGDIIACEPVARYVRSKEPNSLIVWFVRRHYGELLQYNPNIDMVVKINCLNEWIKISNKRVIDRIIDLHINERECILCKATLHKKSGNRNINFKNYYNYGNLISAFCQSAGLPIIDENPIVYTSKKENKSVDKIRLPKNFIVVHCKSNVKERDWSDEKWEIILNKVVRNYDIYIVEIGLQSAIKNLRKERFINLCGNLKVLETAEVIRRAQLFIGVDSGPAHISNAVGTPGIILLGRYESFHKYMPYSGDYGNNRNVNLIYSSGYTNEISTEELYAIVEKELGTK